MAETLYERLLLAPCSLEDSLVTARTRLGRDPQSLDWAAVQLHARRSDGEDTRPLLLRPYRGLLAYQPEHRRFFFGRGPEVHKVVEQVCALQASGRPRLLAVDGASGSGKSSVVLAAVLPELRARLALGEGCAVMRPGPDPLGELARAQAALPQEGSALLVVDQFEEVFTQTPEGASGRAQRQEFARALFHLACSQTVTVHVILTVRSDFVGRCGELLLDDQGLRLDRILCDSAHRVSIAQPSPEQLREVIEEPARLVGLQLEPGLTERLLADVATEPGALPLLADTLDGLWLLRRGRWLTQQSYDELGGIAGALTGRAERLVCELDEELLPIVRHVLVRLVSLSEEGPRTRRRVAMRELLPESPGEAARVELIIRQLVQARLLVRGRAGSAEDESIELAHEALLRRWPRLIGWCDEDRRELRELERLLVWAREHAEHGTLLRGSQLGYAREVTERLSAPAPAAVQALLDASQAEEERQAEQDRSARDAARVLAAQAVAHDPTRVLSILREVESADPSRVPGWLGRATTLCQLGTFARHELLGHLGAVTGSGFSPDGQHCVTASAYGELRVGQAETGQSLAELSLGSSIRDLAFHPDGTQLALALDAGARILSIPDGEILHELEADTELSRACFSPSGQHLWTVGKRAVRRWSVGGEEAPRALYSAECGDEITCSALHPEGEILAVGSESGRIDLLSPRSSRRRSLRGHEGALVRLAFTPNGEHLLSCARDGSLRRWTLAGKMAVLAEDLEEPACLAVAPDGQVAAVGTEEGEIHLVSLDGGGARKLTGHDKAVWDLAFSPDGCQLASVSEDWSAALWVPELHGRALSLLGHQHAVNTLAFSPSGQLLLTGSSDCTARLWEVQRPGVHAPRRLGGPGCGEQPLEDPEDFRARLVFDDEDQYKTARQRARSQDGTCQVAQEEDGRVILSRNGEPERELPVSEHVTALALSPSGDRILVCTEDRGVRLFGSDPDEQIELPPNREAAYRASLSALGSAAVTDSWVVRLWKDTTDPESVRLRHSAGVTLVQHTPDGGRVLTACQDPGAWLWDLRGQRSVLIEPEREEYLIQVRTDCTACVTEHEAGTFLWPLELDPQELVSRMWRAGGFCLSVEERQQLLGEPPEVATEQAQRASARLEQERAGAAVPETGGTWAELLATSPGHVDADGPDGSADSEDE